MTEKPWKTSPERLRIAGSRSLRKLLSHVPSCGSDKAQLPWKLLPDLGQFYSVYTRKSFKYPTSSYQLDWGILYLLSEFDEWLHNIILLVSYLYVVCKSRWK